MMPTLTIDNTPEQAEQPIVTRDEEIAANPTLEALGGSIPAATNEPAASVVDLFEAPSAVVSPSAPPANWRGAGAVHDAVTHRSDLDDTEDAGEPIVSGKAMTAAKIFGGVALVALLIIGAVIGIGSASHHAGGATAPAQATSMLTGLFWSVLLVPAVIAAFYFAVKFGWALFLEWQEQRENQPLRPDPRLTMQN